MTQQERAAALWVLLRKEYGITSMEQFVELFQKVKTVDISAFVLPGKCPRFPKSQQWNKLHYSTPKNTP